MRLVKLDESDRSPPGGPATPGHHRIRPWLAGGLAALLVAAIGTFVEYRLHARLTPPPLVFLAPVTRGPVAARLRIAGTLEASDALTISQPMGGRASQVLVRPGDAVEAGQVVARFDPFVQRVEVARHEARVVAAEADAFRAELAAARLLQRLPLDDSDAEEAMALAQVRVATAAAELEARTRAYRLAQRQLGERVIRSPMAGVVLRRQVEPGQTVDTGAPLLVIGTSPKRLRLVADAPEQALARVVPGQGASFTVPALPGRVFAARVLRLGPLEGPPGARHFPVTLDVVNDDRALAVGMTASLDVDTGARGPVLRVPVAALAFWPTLPRTAEEPAIWVGDARGSALARTPVEVGANDGIHAEIRAAGLGEGQMVAVGFGRAAGQ